MGLSFRLGYERITRGNIRNVKTIRETLTKNAAALIDIENRVRASPIPTRNLRIFIDGTWSAP